MKKYRFRNPETKTFVKGVTISEESKEDIKNLMGWNETAWGYNTELIEEQEVLKDKIFSSPYSDLSVSVNSNGWILIKQEQADINSILVGAITGARAKLIKEAFEYAEELKRMKKDEN